MKTACTQTLYESELSFRYPMLLYPRKLQMYHIRNLLHLFLNSRSQMAAKRLDWFNPWNKWGSVLWHGWSVFSKHIYIEVFLWLRYFHFCPTILSNFESVQVPHYVWHQMLYENCWGHLFLIQIMSTVSHHGWHNKKISTKLHSISVIWTSHHGHSAVFVRLIAYWLLVWQTRDLILGR